MYVNLILPVAIVSILLIALAFLVYFASKKLPNVGIIKAPNPRLTIPPKAEISKSKTRVWSGAAQPAADGSFRIEKRPVQVVRNRPMGRPKIWLDECTYRTVDAICTHQDAWVHYLRWCHEEQRQHLPRQKFLSILSKEVPPVPGERAFAGLRLLEGATA